MLAKQLQGAALATQPVFIEDTFSTYLYTGNGSTQTITNGIDLAGNGGLVWLKSRTEGTTAYSGDHYLFDTVRGATNLLRSNLTNAQSTNAQSLTAFSGTGFSLGTTANINNNTHNFASWTFRKQAKFFDVVTYTGNGVAGRTVAHNLGSVPGCIIIKKTSAASTYGWCVYHRSCSGTLNLRLNSTEAQGSTFNGEITSPTSTTFTVSSLGDVNGSGDSFVAYLFAHDAGGFGAAGTDNVISCGSFTTDGSGNATVNLGYEPQWLLVKVSSTTGSWRLLDNMRGIPTGGNDAVLFANLSAAEDSGSDVADLSATGFSVKGLNASATFIYIAIRRGPMRTPTSGTSVYNGVLVNSSASAQKVDATFPSDLVIKDYRNLVNGAMWVDRLRGYGVASSPRLLSSSTGAEANSGDVYAGSQTTVTEDGIGTGYTSVDWFFRRAPGFFDVVCVTGTGSGATYNHNLSVVPELMIQHGRNLATDWETFTPLGKNYAGPWLNKTNEASASTDYWTAPTSTTFKLQSSIDVSGKTYVVYLFATLSGVSKVGSYTGNGSSQTINCGFTAGARFILIKRTDSTGDWYVWDTARGIVTANDPHLSLNTTAAEVTTDDSVDPDNSGFIVNQLAATNINVNTATYIFWAVA